MNEKNVFSLLAQKVKEKKDKGIITHISFLFCFATGFLDVVNKLEDKSKKIYDLIIEHKVKMAEVIYALLTSMCKDNSDNENHVYSLVQKIQYQVKNTIFFFN